MATLPVRNLDDDLVRRLRIRPAEHGRSAEAEYREILRLLLFRDEADQANKRQRVAECPAEFGRLTGGRGSPPSAAHLLERREPQESGRRRDRARPADCGAGG